jgi:hypothetical protein
MGICGALYDRPDTIGELELERGTTLPNPVRCSLPRGHSGSHSYSDGFGGVSWPNPDSLTDQDAGRIAAKLLREITEQAQYDFPSVIEYNRRKAAERRERIATVIIAMLAPLAIDRFGDDDESAAKCACRYADALIAELDRGKQS